ncbi:MAG: nicotinamide-nucleotide adenylyltransferase [Candidatus Lutacidiplasmatales archaeon]
MGTERGLLVGRFQPFHLGHLEVVRHLRSQRPTEALLLGIGSAQASFTSENPFTAGERFEMIERALAQAKISGCTPVPLLDVDRHAVWVAHLEGLLPTFQRVYTNNPLTRELFERDGYAVESPPWFERERYEGSKIRALARSGGDVRPLLPPAVFAYLEEIHGVERMQRLSGRASTASEPAGSR